LAQVVRYRCEKLGALDKADESHARASTACSAATSPRPAPTARCHGRSTWYNPAAGEEFVLGLKEITLPPLDGYAAGVTRPYSVWLSGHYPRALDGLTRLLSLDMRVLDPAWIGMKLRKLLDYPEPLGDFMARVPGGQKQQNYPSTVAYIARLIIHRYSMLGILDENGYPTRDMGILEVPGCHPRMRAASRPCQGSLCGECGNIHGDPQGWLRLLLGVRGGGELRLSAAIR
jgi:ribonucleoside-diphosphate reductase alpha chain